MMLRVLCCFLAFLQVSWSARDYLIESIQPAKLVSHHTQQVVSQPQYTNQQSANAVPIIYLKEFYYFTAPEDKTEIEALKKLLTSTKKHQQIIFIKSPENPNYEKVLQNLVQNAVQPKTHIYVLQKEPNYTGLQQKFQALQKPVHHKPVVHFVKYSNPLEAQHIQSSIIQQYGRLGGTVVNNIVTNRNFNEAQHQQAPATANRYIQTRAVLPENTPVSKNYAMNYLPNDIDVVPGSSYIPLLKK
ncbi:hypothetical protein DOY81_006646 [Sarcophaga bullata]|nr:hypothetical protein DOY81_006646 [Sarcophaga bullata]